MTPARLRECLALLRCPRCGEGRTLADFPRNRANPSGRGSHCLSCVREYQASPRHLASRKARRQKPENKAKRRAYNIAPETKAKKRAAWRTDWPRVILYGVKLRCRQRGLEFSLTPADIVIPAVCPILGEPFDLTHTARSRNAPSLDRVNPLEGYTAGNVRVISWYANRIKSDCSDPAVFDAIARYMRGEIT